MYRKICHWFNFHNVTMSYRCVTLNFRGDDIWPEITGRHIMQIDIYLFLNSWNYPFIIKTNWNQIIFWPAIISSFSRGETWAVGLRQSWDLYTKYGMFSTRDLIAPITCLWPQSWNIWPISRFMYTSKSSSEMAKHDIFRSIFFNIFFRKSRFLVRLLSLVNIIWLQRDSVKP